MFDDPDYTIINAQQALEIMQDWKVIQVDSETSGKNPHICKLLCFQFGNDAADIRIVLDCESYSIILFKDLLESKFLIGHNLKFDLQFLYNYNIIPRKVYDTMIVEQLLYLGFPYIPIHPDEYKEFNYDFPYLIIDDEKSKNYGKLELSFSLRALGLKYLKIDIDKTVRGEIIRRGLDKSVIMYAAGDVMHLEKIMQLQKYAYRYKNCIEGVKLECGFVPAIAYLEWCGIMLDTNKWSNKMQKDNKNYKNALKALNDFVIKTPSLKKYWSINTQGDLFLGYNTEPVVNINWSSSKQVIPIAKILGFDTNVKDKKTGEDKDSVLEKHLATQKGINDEFLKLYFSYQEYAKVVSSFGQGHLDAVNPLTKRIHTTYKQLGAASGRMSCGSSQNDSDLEKLKKLPKNSCSYPNMQQLPADEDTRSSFVSPEGNLMVSADFSALESRLGADIYNEPEMLKEFVEGSGDMHSLCAKMVFAEELQDIEVKDIKKVRPDLRKKVKSVEFAKQFGGTAFAIAGSLGCSIEEAQKFSDYYDKGFKGVTAFKLKGSKEVRSKGYVLISPITGHKMYWWDWNYWKKRQAQFDSPEWNWDDYKVKHKGTGDAIHQMVKKHFQAASKWDRMALNAPTQGCGAIIIKKAATNLFNWIIDNGYFNKIHLCALVHDEIVCDYPEELSDFPNLLENIMKDAAAIYCKSLEIPAEAAVGNHWIH